MSACTFRNNGVPPGRAIYAPNPVLKRGAIGHRSSGTDSLALERNFMSHTYISDLVHVVFSTKNRRNVIPADPHERLWSFLGGIARKNGFKAIAIGGTENHVHALLSLPATMPLSKAV